MRHTRQTQKSPETRATRRAPERAPAPAARAPHLNPADPLSASPDQLLQLQRQVGNRATNTVIQAKLEVGAAGDRYEQEADRMASAIVSGLRPSAGLPANPIQRSPAPQEQAPVGPEGGEAGSEVEAQLASSEGAGLALPPDTRSLMESHLNADFSRVRIHTGPESQTLNRQLGAQAFTHGADIYMGAGKYQPAATDGRQLLAHELTHVVQQGASQVRRSPRRAAIETDSTGVIHRKLAGTTQAVLALGGSASIKSALKAKLTSVTSKVTHNATGEGSGKYSQILDRLQKYESLEAKYMAKTPQYLDQKEKSQLFGELKEIELLAQGWIDQNPKAAISPDVARQKIEMMEVDDIKSVEDADQRRYHALRMLLPRLRHEQMEIAQDRFFRNEAWSDKTLDKTKTQDDAFGGAVNRLDKVTHKGGGQGREGVFIQDSTWADAKTVGSGMGISLADPNAGARSVAMYQLAKLLDLGVNVIAKTEFATHTSTTNKKDKKLAAPMAKMGVRMELAQGTEAAKQDTAMTAAQAQQQGGDTISLEDPTLQRSLNALQLIDAIAGQLDRHWHNYYIATDGHGHVQGVVGIDLDMSFAPDHKTVAPATNDGDDKLKGSHFVGMPKLVDSEFAHKIVAVQAKQVSDLLTVYLKPAEVTAAVDRFNLVKDACQKVLANHQAILPGGWGAQTAQAQLTDPDVANTSYLGKMAAGTTKHEFSTQAIETTAIRVKDNTDRKSFYSIIDSLERFIWKHALSSGQSRALLDVLLSNYEGTDQKEQRKLAQDLEATPVANWNTLLNNPPAPSALLSACV